jgi:hypothetical protein
VHEVPHPAQVALDEGGVVAVTLQPSQPLVGGRVLAEVLGGDIELVALEDDEQHERYRQHDQDDGRKSARGEMQHSAASLQGRLF